MSSSSFESTGFKSTKVQGFDKNELSNFLRQGDLISTSSGKLNKPKMKEKVIPPGGTVPESLVSFDQDELDKITSSFLNRQRTVKQRAGSFGRAGLLLERT